MTTEQRHTMNGSVDSPPSGFDLFSLAWRRKGLLLLGLIIGLILGSMYYARLTPIYQSTSQVLVVKKRPDALPMQSMDPRFSLFEDYLGTHIALIKSPLLIRQAVERGKLVTLKSFAGNSDPTSTIIGSLHIVRDLKEGGANNILQLTFQGTEATECSVVLESIITAYKKFLDDTYKNVSDDTAKLVQDARDLLDKQLKSKDESYRQFRLENPFLIKTKDGGNLRQERLVGIESRKLRLADRQAEIRDRLQSYEVAKTKGRSPAELLVILKESSRQMADDRPLMPPGAIPGTLQRPYSSEQGSTQRITLDDQYVTLLLQEQKILQDYGDDHPEVRGIRKSIDFLKSRAKLTVDLSGPTRTTLADTVNETIKDLNNELATLSREESFLSTRAKLEQEEARRLIEYELKDSAYRGDLQRTQQLFDSVLKRLQEIDLVKDLGGFEAQTIAPPPATGTKIGPKSFPVFSIAGFCGLLVGLGVASLVELSDRGFKTPEDIRKRLGLPVVGCIPTLRLDQELTAVEQASPLDRSLFVYHRAKSREAEAYRGVRTSLMFSARRHGCKIIQITSPEMADGKSTLVGNLAVAIAQSGKKVILVDADFRRPKVHKLFGLQASLGLASVLRGEADISGVIQPTIVQGLSVLPCGPIPPNPAELLASAAFQEIISSLTHSFDFVLVDTPPLLAVTDPSVVLPCVDGVILTIRLSKNARPNAERARDILDAMSARVLGVVVNEVRTSNAAGYSYGSYYHYGASEHYYAEQNGEVNPGETNPVIPHRS